MIYIKIFCSDFLKLASAIFKIFKKPGLHGARAPFEVSVFVCDYITMLEGLSSSYKKFVVVTLIV
jgi:hypothetical protein